MKRPHTWLIALVVVATVAPGARAEDEAEGSGELQPGALLQYGVTAGLALAMHLPVAMVKDKAELDQVVTSAMPYVLVSPMFWRPWGDVTRKYCATDWIMNNRKAAADRHARQLARERIVEAYYRGLDTGAPTGTGDPPWPPPWPQRSEKDDDVHPYQWDQDTADAAANTTLDVAPAAKVDEKVRPAEELTDLEVYNITGWDIHPEMVGSCTVSTTLFNVWVGLPIDFSGDIRRDDGRSGKDLKPRIAFGYGVLVSAYIHLLLGVSFSEYQPDDGLPYQALWNPVVAIGGNIDLVGRLLN